LFHRAIAASLTSDSSALADNKLSGSLPASFASLTALNGERLLLANSGLCGVVPGTVQPFDGPLPPCAKA
jgi:hypothetical protein